MLCNTLLSLSLTHWQIMQKCLFFFDNTSICQKSIFRISFSWHTMVTSVHQKFRTSNGMEAKFGELTFSQNIWTTDIWLNDKVSLYQYFRSSLTFKSKAKTLVALPIWKYWLGNNTLAYYAISSTMKNSKFMTLRPVVNIIHSSLLSLTN